MVAGLVAGCSYLLLLFSCWWTSPAISSPQALSHNPPQREVNVGGGLDGSKSPGGSVGASKVSNRGRLPTCPINTYTVPILAQVSESVQRLSQGPFSCAHPRSHEHNSREASRATTGRLWGAGWEPGARSPGRPNGMALLHCWLWGLLVLWALRHHFLGRCRHHALQQAEARPGQLAAGTDGGKRLSRNY